MSLPEVDRVIYEKNPLDEVICQVRFPTILKIEADLPAAFQERIRSRYPLYKTRPIGKLPAGLPEDLANLLAVDFPLLPSGKAHEFSSADKEWKVSLTKEFLALSCARYERWEAFKDHLREPLLALEEIYRPTFYSRIGLRYRDVIRRSVLGLDMEWSELLQPWIAGIIAKPEIAGQTQELSGEFVLRLLSHGMVRVRHGLALDDARQEQCYLIDADFFDDAQTEPSHAFGKFDHLNRQSRYLFRWCIRDRLHQAMQPRPLGTP